MLRDASLPGIGYNLIIFYWWRHDFCSKRHSTCVLGPNAIAFIFVEFTLLNNKLECLQVNDEAHLTSVWCIIRLVGWLLPYPQMLE